MTKEIILEKLKALRIKPMTDLTYVCPNIANGFYIFGYNKAQVKKWQAKLEAKGCYVNYNHDSGAYYLHVRNFEKL
jgi:hypothetical protein